MLFIELYTTLNSAWLSYIFSHGFGRFGRAFVWNMAFSRVDNGRSQERGRVKKGHHTVWQITMAGVLNRNELPHLLNKNPHRNLKAGCHAGARYYLHTWSMMLFGSLTDVSLQFQYSVLLEKPFCCMLRFRAGNHGDHTIHTEETPFTYHAFMNG